MARLSRCSSGESGDRWSCVTLVLDQSLGHRFGALCRVGVALGSGDDRAFHQDSPGAGEPVGSLKLASSASWRTTDVLQVLDARSAGWMSSSELEQHVDKRAGFEVIAVKPLVKQLASMLIGGTRSRRSRCRRSLASSSATSAIWSSPCTSPRGAQELALKVQRAQETLTTNTGRSPTVGELAQYLELSIEDVLEGLEAAAAPHSS